MITKILIGNCPIDKLQIAKSTLPKDKLPKMTIAEILIVEIQIESSDFVTTTIPEPKNWLFLKKGKKKHMILIQNEQLPFPVI